VKWDELLLQQTPGFVKQRMKKSSICLARLKQLNRKDREDRKEQSLSGLCGLVVKSPA
jgi:hypothetical protein